MEYDIVFIADPRFPGGTSTAIASEIEAAHKAGYHCGLIGLKAPVLKQPHPYHPMIRQAIDDGHADWLDPRAEIKTRLALLHHPQTASHLPAEPLRLEAENRLLIAHHPPVDAPGKPYYDWRRIDENAQRLLQGPTPWAPVGPACRRCLERIDDAPELWAFDWLNIVDPHTFARDREPPKGPKITMGRHSRPDPQKWPASRDEILKVYPEIAPFHVRILGGAKFLQDLMAPAFPTNWDVLPFDTQAVADFLNSLDLFVYFHHPDWVEAFGRTVIEAMAAGVPTILPPHFQPLFGEAALYTDPDGLADAAFNLAVDHKRWRNCQLAGRDAVFQRFSPQAYISRIQSMIGPPSSNRAASLMPAASLPRSRVVFLTSNGVGLGHLTRCLAIAKRLPGDIEPVFITFSQAAILVEEAGITTHFLPFHAYLGADNKLWNYFLARELSELFRLLMPRVILFDGNMPYGGLIEALSSANHWWSAWIRRAMWRDGKASQQALDRQHHFDVTIEPNELAASLDNGPTVAKRDQVRQVAPIRLIDECRRLSKLEARQCLSLPLDGEIFLVQLGSGNNFDYSLAHAAITDFAGRRPDLTFVVINSPIAEESPELPPPLIQRSYYPLGEVLSAFDGAISAAGYNLFHELVMGGIPALFVPNENPSMDQQAIRANHAARCGWALAVDGRDIYALTRGLEQLSNVECREDMIRRMGLIDQTNGALTAAHFVEEMVRTRRADRD